MANTSLVYALQGSNSLSLKIATTGPGYVGMIALRTYEVHLLEANVTVSRCVCLY